MGDQLKIDTREVDRIGRALGKNREAILRRVAFDLEGAIKRGAAVDTGAMRASVYTVTQGKSGLEGAESEARSRNPKAEIVDLPEPVGDVYAVVGPCVAYAEFVENGTSKMAARPFVRPAGEEIGQKYNSGAAFEELIR